MERSHLGQLLLIGVPGTELDSKTAQIFRSIQPGGYILFGRNIRSPRQLRKLIDDLRDLSTIEPLIAVDQEGGRVSRLKLIGNEPPNAAQLRQKGDRDLIRRHGTLTGELLRLFGFNFDLCPVLDISFDDEADNSLRGRCYGTSAEQVIDFAGEFNRALLATGILTCGKHFPGYSAAPVDPHHELPVVERSREILDRHELAVFRALAGKVSGMMVGHAWYPSLEPERRPASLSRRIVTDLLRSEMRFDGLVLSDDLDMGAVLNEVGFDETIRMALQAGNDIAMICHRVEMTEQAFLTLERMERSLLDRGLAAVAGFKRKLTQPDLFNEERFAELDREAWNLRVAVLGEELARQRSPEDGKRSPVELY